MALTTKQKANIATGKTTKDKAQAAIKAVKTAVPVAAPKTTTRDKVNAAVAGVQQQQKTTAQKVNEAVASVNPGKSQSGQITVPGGLIRSKQQVQAFEKADRASSGGSNTPADSGQARMTVNNWNGSTSYQQQAPAAIGGGGTMGGGSGGVRKPTLYKEVDKRVIPLTAEEQAAVEAQQAQGVAKDKWAIPEYEALDYNEVLDQVEKEKKQQQEDERKRLEDKLGIVRERDERELEWAKQDLEEDKTDARQSALSTYFGGLEGMTSTTTAAVATAIVQKVQEAGMRDIMRLKNDMEMRAAEGVDMLAELGEQHSAEVLNEVNARIKAHSDAYDKAYARAKENRSFYYNAEKDARDWEFDIEKEQTRQGEFAANYNLNVKRYLSGELKELQSFAEKYDGNIAAGIMMERMRDAGMELEPDAMAEFIEAVQEKGIQEALLEKREFYDEFASMDAPARQALIREIPQLEKRLTLKTIHDGMLIEAAEELKRERDAEAAKEEQQLRIYEQKKQIDARYKPARGGGGGGLSLPAGAGEMIDYYLQQGVSPLEFEREIAGMITTTKNARANAVTLYNKVAQKVVETGQSVKIGPQREEYYLMLEAKERDRQRIKEGFGKLEDEEEDDSILEAFFDMK